MNHICLIYNFAQHYRLGVFKLMDEKMNIDFYFGDEMGDVKKLDYKELEGFQKELRNVSLFSHFYWQSGAFKLLFDKRYREYILLGDYYCVSTWVILFFSLFTSKKMYLWTHGWYGKESRSIKIIKKAFFSMGDALFLYGDYAKRLMIKEGFAAEKLVVIYNSLNYKEQVGVRESLSVSNLYRSHFSNDDPVMIFIGRLTPVKKLHYIIEAQKALCDRGRMINLVIIGDGEEREHLRELVVKYHLNTRVWFVGKLYDETRIAEYIFNADICVSPGNVGLTAMHALVYGTPVITHNNFAYQMPEFEAIKDNISGAFFEENNIDSLVKSIAIFLEKNTDRQILRERCFEVIDEKFNPYYQVDKIKETIYGQG